MRLGKKIDATSSDAEAYKKGIDQFVPPLDSIIKVFKNDKELRESTIIGVSNKTNDGASGVVAHHDYISEDGTVNSQLYMTRQSLYRFVDFIFSSSLSDRKYFLGKGKDNKESMIEKYGGLKPCIHGSDAHELSTIFEPAQKRYCWIKADPTFNGLRQILFEPEDRVKISETKPEVKSSYHVIDHAIIHDSVFSENPIYFSDKLTCIIGGKSTGKSILLQNVASTIDSKQVSKRYENASRQTLNIPQMEVVWADGSISKKGEETTHKIYYIPQTYLNRVSEEKEKKTDVDEIIQEIVFTNSTAKKRALSMEQQIKERKALVDKGILYLVQLSKDIENMEEDMLELGTRYGLSTEIEKLKTQKKKLSDELDLSEDDVEKYDYAVTQIAFYSNHQNKLRDDVAVIEEIETVVKNTSRDSLSSTTANTLVETVIKNIIDEANKKWLEQRKEIVSKLNYEAQLAKTEIEANQKVKYQLQEKIESNAAIKELTQLLQKQEQRLTEFSMLEQNKNEKVQLYNELIDSLVEEVSNFRNVHLEYANYINEEENTLCSDLEFSVNTPLRRDELTQKVRELFDNRSLKSHKDIINIDDITEESISIEQLKKLIEAIIKKTLPLTRNYTVESALRTLLDDWYATTYSVAMAGDTLEVMSPGKKALVLLKLLVDLAESDAPILIDQPEDDLDNRSVFDELIPFIREKKLQRQIIVVTHNANVVLGGDAEQIIIANQQGNSTPNARYKFEYRSGAIENDQPVIHESLESCSGILNEKGIQQHICDILEGGERAFDLRKHKYRLKN